MFIMVKYYNHIPELKHLVARLQQAKSLLTVLHFPVFRSTGMSGLRNVTIVQGNASDLHLPFTDAAQDTDDSPLKLTSIPPKDVQLVPTKSANSTGSTPSSGLSQHGDPGLNSSVGLCIRPAVAVVMSASSHTHTSTVSGFSVSRTSIAPAEDASARKALISHSDVEPCSRLTHKSDSNVTTISQLCPSSQPATQSLYHQSQPTSSAAPTPPAQLQLSSSSQLLTRSYQPTSSAPPVPQLQLSSSSQRPTQSYQPPLSAPPVPQLQLSSSSQPPTSSFQPPSSAPPVAPSQSINQPPSTSLTASNSSAAASSIYLSVSDAQVTVVTSGSTDSSVASSVSSSVLFLSTDQMEELGAQGAVVIATGDPQLDDQCLIENFGEAMDSEGS